MAAAVSAIGLPEGDYNWARVAIRSNSKLGVPNHPLSGHMKEDLTDKHRNHYCSDGSIARIEYHALMRMMDEDSHENVSKDEHAELAKACSFSKESTI